ncbi:MAG TPA: hypothetical protein VGD62_12825 [Acidobacteriaceae bacterium]
MKKSVVTIAMALLLVLPGADALLVAELPTLVIAMRGTNPFARPDAAFKAAGQRTIKRH